MFNLIDRAIGFAARAHEGQRRRVGKMPFIAHPVAVAMMLQRFGVDDTVVAAALLHDTVEDTHVTLGDIRRKFGDEVADIVAGCTEVEGTWEERKLAMIDRLREAPLPVKLVVAADKLHNLSHIEHDRRQIGRAVWDRFGRGREQQAWYYRSMLASLLSNVAEPERYPIFEQLRIAVEALFAQIPNQPPADEAG